MRSSIFSSLQAFLQFKPSRAIGLIFLTNGLLFGTWITRIPEIKEILSLSEGDIGLALLMVPFGALAVMPFMGKLTARFGVGRFTFWLSLAYCFAVIAMAFLWGNFYVLCFALFMIGITTGSMDIAMNTAASTIETQYQRTIMSTCHGFWSLGAMIGSASGGYLYGIAFPFRLQIFLLGGAFILMILFLSKILSPLSHQSTSDEPWFALPGKSLIGLAIIAFCMMLSEGAIMDWSTLYMTDSLQADPRISGLAFAAFSATMALARFSGDSWAERIGPYKVLFWGILIAGLSMLAILLIAHPLFAIFGFAIAGFGFANLVPILFGLAGKAETGSPGTNIAAVGSQGYFGMLAGPSLIGFLAEGVGLPLAMGSVVLLCGLALVLVGTLGKSSS